jgi:hypothetical protein
MKILSKKKLLKKAGIIGEYWTPAPWRYLLSSVANSIFINACNSSTINTVHLHEQCLPTIPKSLVRFLDPSSDILG